MKVGGGVAVAGAIDSAAAAEKAGACGLTMVASAAESARICVVSSARNAGATAPPAAATGRAVANEVPQDTQKRIPGRAAAPQRGHVA